MIFNALTESAERGELMLVDNGICNWHLRQDGQLTIREIISTRPDAGQRMLNRLLHIPGATSLFAKCPAELPSNDWYKRRGFTLEGHEKTRAGNTLNLWRLVIHRQRTVNAGAIELVYSSGGNPRFAEIAIDAGMLPGACASDKVYWKPYFMDQDYKNPNLDQYEATISKYKPYMATVIDWQHHVPKVTVWEWCEAIAPHVEELIIIPKIPGTIKDIPDTLFNRPVRLGYSIPSSYGGTPNSLGEFASRPVHLLGGSPEKQLQLAQKLNVASVDNNYIQQRANSGAYWSPKHPYKSRNQWFVTLSESDGGWHGENANEEAFRRSCHNVMQAWRTLQVKREQMPAQLALFEEAG